MLPQPDLEALHQRIADTIAQTQKTTFVAVNTAMVTLYWEIGRMIVAQEQQGASRANYGEYLIVELAKRLKMEFGKGYSERNLRHFRMFYNCFPIRNAVRSELTWTHYRLLMRVANPNARAFYEEEAVRGVWTTRALERQMNTFYYERILASSDRPAIVQEATEKIQQLPVSPLDFVKDPYVLEFLGVKAGSKLYESDLEQLIIDNLQGFLLELGRGFSFVARQQLMRAEHENFYIDLVFYNYLLKCFVLIDLKMGKLTHQDIGQMDMYVRMYEDKMRLEGDNPTIGIVLCSEKNEAVAKYSVLNESQHLFASKYLLYLPSEAELKAELERERILAELRLSEQNKQ